MSVGFGEILLILVVTLLLFGAKRLPDLARSMGKALGEFKKGMSDIRDESEMPKAGKPDHDERPDQ